MYKSYYGFKENAFNITSDPDFYFESSRHREAYSHLLYGIRNRKGIISLTGEVGTGKTTLCRILLNTMDKDIITAFILNPSFSEIQLLQMINKDLGIECEKNSKLDLTTALNNFLLEKTSKGMNIAVIIDEAQNLRVNQLEQIRLLSNLETEKFKLLQVILVGQPELLDKLKKPELRQLNSRIGVRYHMLPLDKNDIANYIRHRIHVAGGPDSLHFTPAAVEAVYHYSHGTPRLINILCEHALLAGFVRETRKIDEDIIKLCAREALAEAV